MRVSGEPAITDTEAEGAVMTGASGEEHSRSHNTAGGGGGVTVQGGGVTVQGGGGVRIQEEVPEYSRGRKRGRHSTAGGGVQGEVSENRRRRGQNTEGGVTVKGEGP